MGWRTTVLAWMACSAVVATMPSETVAMPESTMTSTATDASDPFAWLEDVHGEKPMAWVKAENTRTLSILESDPRFPKLQADALAIAQAADRIPHVAFRGGRLYNFWQDSEHVRGLWRRTDLADYAKTAPTWETVLDLDALAKAEGENWVYKGADCEWRDERLCLVSLSDGGEDAVTTREFDLKAKGFVTGGFVLPKGKQRVDWADTDTLLVSREWAPGELTTSGYPFVVKTLKRGQPLAMATEIFRGAPSDGGYGVTPYTLHDGEGGHVSIIHRPLNTFEGETWIVTPSGPRRLAIPLKASVDDLVAGRLIVNLRSDWIVDGQTLPQGAIAAIDLKSALRDPDHPKAHLILAAGPRESIESFGATKSKLFVVMNVNVKGRAFVFTPTGRDGWTRRELDLPGNAAIGLSGGDAFSNRAFFTVTDFLTPTSLWLADEDSGQLARIKTTPPKFDSGPQAVEQFEAISSDGVKIPYFIVHPKAMKRDGQNPTILTAYGGFQVSRTPGYDPIMGKLWLERGGVYVLANIRGGGEFGPAWHEAGLKTRRQIIYDDFAAVARDLIARGVTSPRRLGIQGGSNGGLLMGVEMTQHPALWRAVDIAVPLLDMLGYEHIAAGSSWVGEYGSVSIPAERAFLASISPYHQLKSDVTYPEPLIWTTTKDDRVGPQHARKFAARMAAMGKPYLFYEVVEGGHGAGANLKESAHTAAVQYAYFLRKLVD